MNPALEDEITSITAIYEPTTLTTISTSPPICALVLPQLSSTSLRLEFPLDYPDVPPSVLGTLSVGNDMPKGVGTKLVELVRDVLARIYRSGEPCIFDLIQEVGDVLENDEDVLGVNRQLHGPDSHGPNPSSAASNATGELKLASAAAPSSSHTLDDTLGPEPPWILSDPLTVQKSLFLARAASCTSPETAKSYIAHLLATDKRTAKATHNISAWRIRGASGTVYQDCDDDGETAAGGRVLHLLQVMDAWDVVVVVSRWFGGVLLGPERFRCINGVAREAVIRGGFAKEEGSKKKGKK